MKIEQTSVHHARYGTGTVVTCEGSMIVVDFPEAGRKPFMFPDAFEKFLQAEDPDCAAEIASLIILKKAEEAAAKKEEEARLQALAEARAQANSKTRSKTK